LRCQQARSGARIQGKAVRRAQPRPAIPAQPDAHPGSRRPPCAGDDAAARAMDPGAADRQQPRPPAADQPDVRQSGGGRMGRVQVALGGDGGCASANRMTTLLAYADAMSVRPGDTINFKVSCDGRAQYNARIVRLLSPEAGPQAPPFRTEPVN